MSSLKPVRFVAAGIAAVAIGFAAYAVGNSNSDAATAGTANAARAAPAGQQPGYGQVPQNGQRPAGFGTRVTGSAANKAKAAALAKYDGTVEQVMKLGDGSYLVHVITSNGEYHVAVSKEFKVTGADQGGPGGAGSPRSSPPGATS